MYLRYEIKEGEREEIKTVCTYCNLRTISNATWGNLANGLTKIEFHTSIHLVTFLPNCNL